MFDPYRKWLGIPESQRPPTHYQLLGISADEQDRDVINAAVMRQSAFVRNFQVGPHSAEATQVLNEIAAAKVCLLDPVKRAEYDRELASATLPKSVPPTVSHASGGLDNLRSSKVLGPLPVQPSSSPAPAMAPAAARSGGHPVVGMPRRLPTQSARRTRPFVLSPARRARRGPSVWLWGVPVGVMLAILLIVLTATRNSPSTADVAQTVLPAETKPAIQPQSSPQIDRTPPKEDPLSSGTIPTAPSAQVLEAPSLSATNARGATSQFSDSAAWTAESTLALPVPRNSSVVFARSGSPFVAIGPTVYNLDDGREVGQTGDHGGQFESQTLRALSDDGKFYAIARRGQVEVRRCQDGQNVSSLAGDWAAVRLEFLDFGSPGQLVTGVRSGDDEHLAEWDVATGKLLKKFAIESVNRNIMLSDDGRFVAVELPNEGIGAYDLLESPSKGNGKIYARFPIASLAGRALTINGFRFSPSSEELAAVCDDGARVLCWNNKAESVFQHSLGTDLPSLGMATSTYRGPVLEWQPGGRGWLLAGHAFLDRRARRVTWLLKSDFGSTIRHRFLDGDRLTAIRQTRDRHDLVDLKIPWKKIDESLTAMHRASTPAWLGPARQLSLQVQLGQVTGSPDQVETNLRTALAVRLAADKIGVGNDAPVQLVVEYAEEYTPSRTIAPRNVPGVRVNAPASQMSGSTSGRLKLRLQTTDMSKMFWTGSLVVDVNHTSGAESPRREINAELASRLQAMLLPYFLPKENNLLPLPVVISP